MPSLDLFSLDVQKGWVAYLAYRRVRRDRSAGADPASALRSALMKRGVPDDEPLVSSLQASLAEHRRPASAVARALRHWA